MNDHFARKPGGGFIGEYTIDEDGIDVGGLIRTACHHNPYLQKRLYDNCSYGRLGVTAFQNGYNVPMVKLERCTNIEPKSFPDSQSGIAVFLLDSLSGNVLSTSANSGCVNVNSYGVEETLTAVAGSACTSAYCKAGCTQEGDFRLFKLEDESKIVLRPAGAVMEGLDVCLHSSGITQDSCGNEAHLQLGGVGQYGVLSFQSKRYRMVPERPYRDDDFDTDTGYYDDLPDVILMNAVSNRMLCLQTSDDYVSLR